MNLNWFFPVSLIMISVFLMIKAFRLNRRLLFKGEEATFRKYLIGSLLSGSATFLLTVGIILPAGLISKDFGWSGRDIIWIVILGLGCGILATIGSLWSYFIAGKFRTVLFQKLKEKYKK
jgi:hypothetical protein